MARHERKRKNQTGAADTQVDTTQELVNSGTQENQTMDNLETVTDDTNGETEVEETEGAELVGDDEVFDRPYIDILDPDAEYELLPDNVKTRYSDSERAILRDMVAAGLIQQVKAKVTIAKKTSKTGKDEHQPFFAYVPTNYDAMLAQCNGKLERATSYEGVAKTDAELAEKERVTTRGLIDYFFYGLDLEVRNWIRQSLSAGIQGPLLSVSKTVAAMLKNKNAADIEDALDTIAYGMKKRGKTLDPAITVDAVKKALKM